MSKVAERPQGRGFTIIELMIVMVIIAVLATIAYPSFIEQVRKGRRADAVASLNRIMQAQERWRANNATYSTDLSNAGLNVAAPSSGYYTLQVTSATATGYTAVATAAGAQLGDTRCATMTVALAAATLTYTATPAANSNLCWNR
jgi:type IV pilus assembly protein PilE